jgi:hypothetical protein
MTRPPPAGNRLRLLRPRAGRIFQVTVTRARAIAAVLLSTLLCQLAVAVPALAIERILAARCCDLDCPERPSAATADRCCAIGATAAADPTLRSVDTTASAAVDLVLANEPVTAPREPALLFVPVGAARAAPLYLTQRSLQL